MTDKRSLIGRTALVSGGARGIGAAHARALHEAGAFVIVGDVLEEEGRATATARLAGSGGFSYEDSDASNDEARFAVRHG